MCLIVDNDVIARVFSSSSDPDFGTLHERIFVDRRPSVVLHVCVALMEEYVGNSRVRLLIAELVRKGQAILADEDKIEAESNAVQASGLCKSNDHHVIALARVSGARMLCSLDRALHRDFTNGRLIRPRGRVYQSSAHDHLLVEDC